MRVLLKYLSLYLYKYRIYVNIYLKGEINMNKTLNRHGGGVKRR